MPKLDGEASKNANEKSWRSIHQTLKSGGRILEWCKVNDVTGSSLFQLTWSLVLRAYTHSDQTCFGYLTSGRDAPLDRINDSVGPYINMLLCRMQLSDNIELLQVLRKCQNEYVAALSHQHIPLSEILQVVDMPVRPLFNTIMSISQTASATEPRESSIHFTIVEAVDPTEV